MMALQTRPRKTAIEDATVASVTMLMFQPNTWLTAQMSAVQKSAGSRDTMAMPTTAVMDISGVRPDARDADAAFERTSANCSGKMFIQCFPLLSSSANCCISAGARYWSAS